ncbi:MarR family winged helix-turn-helix transcriptional regulator [Streptomyces abyssomicinicus]|uniref:MarR family winged helix-turn-helix transcriptional regulator n=1 Tax=Streptomyces abyssomicinicus TaxID=574929 RepID=UPI00124FF2E3|nr:MarR family winged helix-turn-helix transcriptional regulator [Streptomyces abyssomicinicus]
MAQRSGAAASPTSTPVSSSSCDEAAGSVGPESRLSLLLARHGGSIDARLRAALTASGVTPRHAIVLMHLAGGPLGQRDLGTRLGVDPSVLVALLNALEDRDLVRRRRDPADRRRHIVEITEAGATAVTKLDAAIGHVEGELFGDLTPQERDTLHSLLARVRTTNGGACDDVEDEDD